MCAHRGIPAAELAGWIEEREQWIEDACDANPDLWRIPLLATLVTVKAACHESAPLPATRAQLLADAVLDAVKRWEFTRSAGTGVLFHHPVRAEQLIDGFREIGHALADVSSRPSREVRAAVAAMLTDIWGLARGETSAQAEEIMRFWDDHVGVFVKSSVTGDVEARRRIFAETADAMWATGQDHAAQRAWVSAAIASGDRREPAILAASLSPDVARKLVRAAGESSDRISRSRAALWVADAAADGATLDDGSLSILMSQLAGLARDPVTDPVASDDAPPGSGPGSLIVMTRFRRPWMAVCTADRYTASSCPAAF